MLTPLSSGAPVKQVRAVVVTSSITLYGKFVSNTNIQFSCALSQIFDLGLLQDNLAGPDITPMVNKEVILPVVILTWRAMPLQDATDLGLPFLHRRLVVVAAPNRLHRHIDLSHWHLL